MLSNKVIYDRDDRALIAAFAGCSLNEKPGKNWVEAEGGLPTYICEIARAIKKTGKSTSQAIAIAVSRVKKWASGAGVDADTQAKASKALAQWEKLKGKANGSRKVVKATNEDTQVLNLTDFSLEQVQAAFRTRNSELRRQWRANNPSAMYDDPNCPADFYIRETWNTFLIAAASYGRDAELYKIPYTVGDKGEVDFSDAVKVKTQFVVVDEGDDDDPGATYSDAQLKKLIDMSNKASPAALEKLIRLAARG